MNWSNLVNTQGRAVDFNSSLDRIDSSYVNTVEQSKINGYLVFLQFHQNVFILVP